MLDILYGIYYRHFFVKKRNRFGRCTAMGNSCIHMYARSGDVDAAIHRFQEMLSAFLLTDGRKKN